MIPGSALHRLARMLCSTDMSERVIDAFFADFQREWLEAATLRARASTLVRGYASFWVVLACGLMRDVRSDFHGFQTRVAAPIVFLALIIGLLLIGTGAPSWVETGHVKWSEGLKGFVWTSGLLLSVLIGRYRARYAERRSVSGFALALTLSIVFLLLHRVTDRTIFRWAFLTSLNMTCPFLVRKPSISGPAEAGHYR